MSAGAEIAEDVEIGPFCVVDRHVSIGPGCRLIAHVYVGGHTWVGARTIIYPFASLGTPPQSLKYRGGPTRLVIGTDCQIRESVTMNVGTEDGIGVTTIGDRGFYMAHSHVGHDCLVGTDAILANGACLGGHCRVGDFVFMGGLSAAHQFSRIGSSAMIAGVTGVRSDIIPFGFAVGSLAYLGGLNTIGMKRRQLSPRAIRNVWQAYRQLFFGPGLFADRIDAVQALYVEEPAVATIIDFVRQGGARPLCHPRRSDPTLT